MKKLLIIFLFISNLCYSQGHHSVIFRDSKLTDSILANGQNKLYIRSDIVGIYTRDTVRVLVDSIGNIVIYGEVTVDNNVIINGTLAVPVGISGNGANITDLNASELSTGTIDTARIPNTAKIDTANFAHTNSGITEIFNSIVSFATTVTFTVSPVFSALVNFANGINVTGNATVSGFFQQGSLARNEKVVFKTSYISGTNANSQVAHGIPNWKNITSFSANIRHDSDNSTNRRVFAFGYNLVTPNTGGLVAWADSLNFYYYINTTAYGLIGDSVLFRATYTDSY